MNTKSIVTAGNKGEKVRSDCFVSLELTEAGGIQIELKSKVKVMYGETILSLIKEILSFYEIEHASLIIEDKGALPFVIMTRLESAVKLLINTEKEFLPPMLPQNESASAKDKYRLSRLYVPGNNPALMINAGIYHANGVIFDLEDAVHPTKKAEARILVRNALRALDLMGAERMVRINQLPLGLDDLNVVIPQNVNVVLIPKCESPKQIREVNHRISIINQKHGLSKSVWLMPIIESALGVLKSFEIALAAENIVGLAIGLEDYTADIGANRTNEGTESLFARSYLLNACKAAGIQAIDSVFADFGNIEAMKENALRSKSLGFDGMGCIHPSQIKIVHDSFAPSEKEIAWAMEVVNAFKMAEENGNAVVSIGTKMIDAPVVKRAKRIIDISVALGLHKDKNT